jgi:hypothetical protein
MHEVLHQRGSKASSLIFVDYGESDLGTSGLHNDAPRPTDNRGPDLVVHDRDESQMLDEVDVQEEGNLRLGKLSLWREEAPI